MNLYKGEAIFDLSFEEATNDNDVVRALDNIIQEIKEKDIPEFNQKDEDGKDIFTAYEEVKNGIFEVSVIATMSSGNPNQVSHQSKQDQNIKMFMPLGVMAIIIVVIICLLLKK